MTSTPRRLALTCLAVPLLAALNGCTEPLATTTDDTDAGTSTGETGDEPTGGDPTTDAPTTDAPTEQQQRYFLHVDDTPPPPLPAIELDKEKTLEVFGEKAAKQIHLIDVDSGPLIDEVLHRILYACGDKWDDYDPTILDKDLPASPKHDCSLTELGKTFGTTETDRLKSPEYQLVRLLTMTPRNAQVRGTIMNDMSDVYTSYENSFNKLSFQDVLAASLFCPTDDRPEIVKIGDPNECVNKMQLGNPNEKKQEADLHVRPFISTEVLADTLRVTLLDSHPLLKGKNGMMAVTLYDALKDMQPLSVKYGPDAESGHPGVLKPDDENFTTKSDALTDQFKMVAFAESNLRRVEGIDASVGAGELYINVLPDEDTSDDVHPPPLNFDFNDPEKVRIEGLTPDPTVDMRMQMFEIDGGAEPGTLAPVSSCDGAHGDDIATCMANLPDTPVGDQYVWSQKVWTLEYIIAHAGHAALKDRVYSRCFAPFIQNNQLVACFAEVFIGVAVNNTPTPPGWTSFSTELDTPKFPPAQYFWELLLDVAQESLHDYTDILGMAKIADGIPEIEEGDLNPTFTLRKLPIGLTSAELEKELRPNLQSQAHILANTVLGRFWKNNARLDFYYRRGNEVDAGGGAPMLFFVAPSDLRPSKDDPGSISGYGYANPGFFADAALQDKLSSTTVPGSNDSEHEKYQLAPGKTTLYMQDDDGITYSLEFLVPEGADPTEIVVRVDPV
jgi:hypothetical protein